MEMVPIPLFLHYQLRRALFNRNWAIYVENNHVCKKWRKLWILHKKSIRYYKISVKYTGTRYKILHIHRLTQKRADWVEIIPPLNTSQMTQFANFNKNIWCSLSHISAKMFDGTNFKCKWAVYVEYDPK